MGRWDLIFGGGGVGVGNQLCVTPRCPVVRHAVRAHQKLLKLFRVLILDVGGRRHKVLESNFNIFPNTRLGKLVRARTEEDILNLCDGYLEGEVPEYFFDRNWHSFNSILVRRADAHCRGSHEYDLEMPSWEANLTPVTTMSCDAVGISYKGWRPTNCREKPHT